ncbi:hypothetical protein F0L68_37465 [Solihabitans fulvus]|uniref:Uncharacterized protein n=1 Tax=Solihabitans fulvus TaxID=1892852 RepID=A0A5B2WIY5_9PSEU|nr:hypothetical protein [Solihabitans fulvus]KAA2251375.1 hypothetical protein F0L68_37465 [Solihabitans fulvus]
MTKADDPERLLADALRAQAASATLTPLPPPVTDTAPPTPPAVDPVNQVDKSTKADGVAKSAEAAPADQPEPDPAEAADPAEEPDAEPTPAEAEAEDTEQAEDTEHSAEHEDPADDEPAGQEPGGHDGSADSDTADSDTGAIVHTANPFGLLSGSDAVLPEFADVTRTTVAPPDAPTDALPTRRPALPVRWILLLALLLGLAAGTIVGVLTLR